MSEQIPDGKVGEAGAIYAFMSWLVSRKTPAGPFSRRHKMNQAAELAKQFCDMQGWEVIEGWDKRLLRWEGLD